MSKLWIVHRNPRRLDALARLSGLTAPDLVCGNPTDSIFEHASPPAAILIATEQDLELELEFLHRHRRSLEGARRILLTTPGDVAEVGRLFEASSNEILDALPPERTLRSLILSAVAHRNAGSLAQRRNRDRIKARFASWYGDLEIPGLMRALDPNLAALPLLVRGVKGSGRSLVARYANLFRFRDSAGTMLRIHAREIATIDDLVARMSRSSPPASTDWAVWIDEIDSLNVSTQQAIGEWIRLDAPPTDLIAPPLHWIATAGAPDLANGLEANLERAFSPLTVVVPSLLEQPESLAPFVERVVQDWTATFGGVPRELAGTAIEALEAQAWSGDRVAVEAALRSALARTAQEHLDESHFTPFGVPLGVADEDSVSLPEAVFVEEDPPLDPAGAAGASEATIEVEPASEAFDEFERAFLDGLPSAEPVPLSESQAPDLDSESDVSTAMSDASFRVAEDGETESGAEPDPGGSRTGGSSAADWRRLARSLSHEIRNPLVSIRTFAELLPEHFADESFRERFTELVGRDVAHIDEVVSRLASAAEREKAEASRVDVSVMIEALLDERRERIAQGRLLVLRELERDAPNAWADAHSVEVALAGLLDRAIASLPERGDLFVATRRIERSADGTPRLRVLLRHHNPELGAFDTSGLEELGSAANVLEYVLAETIVESSGGTLTIDSTDSQETLILVDLPTPE